MLDADIQLRLGKFALDAAFTAAPGEVVALLGPNGSGKSTVLKALTGLLPLAGGRVELDGTVLDEPAARTRIAPEKRPIALMFQDYLLFPHLSALENVAFGLRATGTDKDAARRKAADALAQVGIEDGAQRLRQYPHQMSGGILQRIMIAAALLTEPRLLLADEPTTALDVTTQAEVMAILDGLRRDFGLAMLFITHDLELAAAICDRTVVMYAGQIVEVRASGLLHGDPLHPYTAALAAARPDIAQTAHRLRAIPGRPLSAFEAPPSECAFAPRCPHARDICRAGVPALAGLDGGLSRCARAYELRGQLQEVPRA